MYALTVLEVTGNQCEILPGSLLPVPGELLSNSHKKAYCSARPGWSKCPLGYSFYVVNLHDGKRLVVPGIDVPGEVKPKRRPVDYPLRFRRASIETFAKSIIDEDARVQDAVTQELGLLTHDLRQLSNEIYNAAELVKNDLPKHPDAAAYRIETVLAAQHMLSLRLDIVDFSTGQFQIQEPDRISIFRKCDKVGRTLRPKARAREITVNLQGPSDGFAFGPPTFELIPYVLLQNAIKYSPDGEVVSLKVSDVDNAVTIHVQSYGPRILPDEVPKIFDRGFRGSAAKATSLGGSGLGLFAAKTMIESGFGGAISVRQDNHAFAIGGRNYWRTTFTLTVPRVP